jgi:hypothetical protein
MSYLLFILTLHEKRLHSLRLNSIYQKHMAYITESSNLYDVSQKIRQKNHLMIKLGVTY